MTGFLASEAVQIPVSGNRQDQREHCRRLRNSCKWVLHGAVSAVFLVLEAVVAFPTCRHKPHRIDFQRTPTNQAYILL